MVRGFNAKQTLDQKMFHVLRGIVWVSNILKQNISLRHIEIEGIWNVQQARHRNTVSLPAHYK